MKLEDVYNTPYMHQMLFDMLKERKPEQSISHKQMPSWHQHCQFVNSRPYLFWYFIRERGYIVGNIYLSRQFEIGIHILEHERGHGLATQAIQMLMEQHPFHRYLANINPANEASINLFRKLGFSGPIQMTLEKQT